MKCGFPVSKQNEPKYQPVLKPSEKLIADKVQKVKTTRKVVKNQNKDVADRTVNFPVKEQMFSIFRQRKSAI